MNENSPTLLKWIILPPLSKENVKKIVLSEFKIQENLIDLFSQILTEYSGGIPGILQYIYNTLQMIQNRFPEFKFESEDEIKEILNVICKFISKNALDFQSMNFYEPDYEIIIVSMILYSLSIFGISFNINDTLPGTKHSLRELLPRTFFWITGKENELFIVHSKIKYSFLDKFQDLPTYQIINFLKYKFDKK